MNSNDSQIYDSYLPIYDVIPHDWEKARQFLVEQLKRISDAVNIREIGWFLDEELISGKQFIPSANEKTGEQGPFRTILRKVVNVSPLAPGINTFAHGITYDINFTLIALWVAATNSTTLVSQQIDNNQVTLDAVNINITSPGAFDRAFCIIEYIQEQ